MYTCDCGQNYETLSGLDACQACGHSAAPGCELADANREVRLAGELPTLEFEPGTSFPRSTYVDETNYSGLVAALDRASGAETDECFPDLRPSVLQIVRACPPSAELVELLTRLTLEHQSKGQTDLAIELLSLALCARSARRGDRPF